MTTLLVGHRGVGKSSFLKALSSLRTYDLDREIEAVVGLSVAEIFSRLGEPEFRRVETEVLRRLIREASGSTAIAVGAGAALSAAIQDNPNVRTIWIRRETDGDGRCFLDRPRLDSSLSPFDEYCQRFVERENGYHDVADEQLFLPEGYDGGLAAFVNGRLRVPYDLTLLPDAFRKLMRFVERRQLWDVRRFELRNDLLSPLQMEMASAQIPLANQIWSLRIQNSKLQPGVINDWALELGAPPANAHIVSLHTRLSSLSKSLAGLGKYASKGRILKAAPEIQSFTELEEGHRWWLEDPTQRSFLPRSVGGRWRWYRSLFGPRMPVHFFREGEGSSLDQPLLWQCVLQPRMEQGFAAVLGNPVHQSRTPIEQREFFAQRGLPVVAIPLMPEEFVEALPILRRLGLTHAAVTAPLKILAFEAATAVSEEASKVQSANTLFLGGNEILAANTDVLALQELQSELDKGVQQRNVWLWGGGGVKSSVLAAWPEARTFSARQGVGDERSGPADLLIWATGRKNPFLFPKPTPQRILDLNYTDDSPGLEYAVKENLPYQSGLKMFKLQAEFQRRYWSQR